MDQKHLSVALAWLKDRPQIHTENLTKEKKKTF